MNLFKSFRRNKLLKRRGYSLLKPVLHTTNVQAEAIDPPKLSIELQDNIQWWTKCSQGHFNDELYLRVVKAKMQSA